MVDILADTLSGNTIKTWGRNPTVGTGWEDLTSYAQPTAYYTILGAGAKLDVSSSSTADTNTAGTGARKIRIVGLDASGAFATEILNMTGQTVATTANTYTDVWGADVVEAGTGTANAGDIHIVKTGTGGTYTGGVPGTLTSAICKILTGWNTEMLAHYKVPTGSQHVYRAAEVCAGTYTQAAVIGIFLQQPGSATDPGMHLACVFNVGSTAGPVSIDLRKAGLVLTAGYAIHVRALGASASAVVSANLLLETV